MFTRLLAIVLLLQVIPEALAVGPPLSRLDRNGDLLPAGAIARLGDMRFRRYRGQLVLPPLFAVSPDGTKVVSGRTHIWDRRSGKLLHVLRPQGAIAAECALFTHDSKKVLVGRDDVTTIDLTTGKTEELWQDDKYHGVPRRLALSKGDRALAVWCRSRENGNDVSRIRLYDLATKKALGEQYFDRAEGGEICFTPDGKSLLISEDELHVWDVASARVVRKIAEVGSSRSLAVSPDGKTLAFHVADKDGQVNLIDLGSKKVVKTEAKSSLHWSTLRFTRDGKELLFAPDSGDVVALDATTGKQKRMIVASDDDLQNGTISPDGRWLVRASRYATSIIDMQTGKPELAFDDHRDGSDIEVVPSPNSRALATRSRREVRLGSLPDGKLLRCIPGKLWSPGLRWSSDGKQLVCANNGKMGWYDAGSGKCLKEVALPPGTVRAIRSWLLPDNKRIGHITADSKAVILSADTGKVLVSVKPKARGEFLGLSEDGERALWRTYAEESYTFQLEDISTGKVLWEHARGRTIGHARTYLSGRFVVFADNKNLVTWDLNNEHFVFPPAELPQKDYPALPEAFTADGRMFLVKQITGVRRQGRGYWTFVFGYQLASHVHLIEPVSGKSRHALPHLWMKWAAFTPDGKYLITSQEDGTVLIWDHYRLRRGVWGPGLWKDLASTDGQTAFAAICTLVAHPRRSVPLLHQHLSPARVNERQVRQWLDDLDSGKFASRAKAEEGLEALGEEVLEDLLLERKKTQSVEVRLRVDRLLKKLKNQSPEQQCWGRAIEALEHMGTPEATRLLQHLASGHRGSRRTREAKEALARVRSRGRG